MIKQDAVNIFSKYIAKDALHSIETTDAVRNDAISWCFKNIIIFSPFKKIYFMSELSGWLATKIVSDVCIISSLFSDKICAESGEINESCFDAAQKFVYAILAQRWAIFLKIYCIDLR